MIYVDFSSPPPKKTDKMSFFFPKDIGKNGHSNDVDLCLKKGRDLTQSYDETPLRPHKNPKSNMTTQNATKNFDYTTIADRHRTLSWSNDRSPTGVVKPVNWIPAFTLTLKDRELTANQGG